MGSSFRDVNLAEGVGLTRLERLVLRAELVGKIARKIREKPFAHWEARFVDREQMGLPVFQRKELAADPYFRARGLVEEHTRQDGTVLRQTVKCSAITMHCCRGRSSAGEQHGERFD